MFSKNSKDQFKNSSIIGESVVIEGNFECDEDVVIHGKISGSIRTSYDVYIKQTAVIKASIKASNVFIEGSVEGNIDSSDFVEILSTASVSGDISTGVINIEKGAFFNGKCTIKKEESKVNGSDDKKEDVIESNDSLESSPANEEKKPKSKKQK